MTTYERTLPHAFIREHLRLSWRDALWGYEIRLIGWSTVVDLAVDRLEEGSEDALEIELAGILKTESHLVRFLYVEGVVSPEEAHLGYEERLLERWRRYLEETRQALNATGGGPR